MTGARILYIEDNFENRTLIKRVLEAEGYTVIEAETGKVGLSKAETVDPNLILMDINLPDIDGYDCTALLRKIAKLNTVPIIALTANVMEGDRQKALDAGLDGYIPKPVDIDTLPGQVAGFLKVEGGQRAAAAAVPAAAVPAPASVPNPISRPVPPPPVRVSGAPPPPPPPVRVSAAPPPPPGGSAPRPVVPNPSVSTPPPPPPPLVAGTSPPPPPAVPVNAPVSKPAEAANPAKTPQPAGENVVNQAEPKTGNAAASTPAAPDPETKDKRE